jgi:hypothetical protein
VGFETADQKLDRLIGETKPAAIPARDRGRSRSPPKTKTPVAAPPASLMDIARAVARAKQGLNTRRPPDDEDYDAYDALRVKKQAVEPSPSGSPIRASGNTRSPAPRSRNTKPRARSALNVRA